ncbi:MAG: RnfABCDGE type electron transport complex subunit D [Oscillospiraceae bacterium]|nr:RnfABCDGE type electron transport complex subunit D [Oscillospiraceae bacterium]
MANNLIVTSSPHIQDSATTRKLMGHVIIALLPTVAASAIIFGWEALLLTGVTVAACVGFEALYCLLMKKKNPVGDLSAVVTGILLAFNMPVTMVHELYIPIIGAFIAVVLVKQLFGGLGMNFANPAIVARIVLAISFTDSMTRWVFPQNGVDVLASATPLAANPPADGQTLMTLLMGNYGGVIGETCAITLLLGGVYLIATKTINAVLPIAYLGTVAVFSILAGQNALVQLLSGGLLLGAFFMATDYVTSPFTFTGKLAFGIGLGLLTCLIRFYANMPEGVSYSILIMNLLVPYLNVLTRQKPLGARKEKKHKENTGEGGAKA